jgi:chromosome partitioning protein
MVVLPRRSRQVTEAVGGDAPVRIVSLVTQKGGTGKSSLAVSLAVAAAESGLRTVVLDIDPQGTAEEWFKRRTAEAPAVHSISWANLSSRLYKLGHQGYELAIIDTPGADGHAALEAMKEAHFCLLPVRPSVADIEASKLTVRYLNDHAKPFAFVLNQCPTGGRTSRTSNARMALQLLGRLCDPTLAHRSDHVDALASGQGVTEFNPYGKAAEEVRAVLQWLTGRLRRLEAIETADDEAGSIPLRAVL